MTASDATYRAVISLDHGVMVFLPVSVSNKHFTSEKSTAELERLADKLGGTFLYLEEIDNGK